MSDHDLPVPKISEQAVLLGPFNRQEVHQWVDRTYRLARADGLHPFWVDMISRLAMAFDELDAVMARMLVDHDAMPKRIGGFADTYGEFVVDGDYLNDDWLPPETWDSTEMPDRNEVRLLIERARLSYEGVVGHKSWHYASYQLHRALERFNSYLARTIVQAPEPEFEEAAAEE